MAEMTKTPMFDNDATRTSTNGSKNTQQDASATSPDVAKQAKEVVSHVATQAKGLVAAQVEQQQKRSAGELGNVAKALRHTSEELHGNVASPYVERAAEQVEKVTEFLRTANLNQIVTGVERFARREPLLFLGGAFALGILGARFLKSSAHHADGAPTVANGSYRVPSNGTEAYGADGGERTVNKTEPGAYGLRGDTGRL